MSSISLVCIRCPLGCSLEVTIAKEGSVAVEGNRCPRGEAYGISEATNPVRTVTATVCVPGALEPLSAKTVESVPCGLVREVAAAIAALKPTLPVRAGDVLCDDICGTGVSVVATKSLP